MTRPDKVTIYEVAQLAGVSIATVSHALNRPEKVSQSTRTKVLQAVDQLDFVPKANAVSQARKGFTRVGVLAPFSSYESYRTRLMGVLSAFADQPVDVVVFDHSSVADSPSPLLGSLPTTGRLDGMIVMGVPLDDALASRLTSRKMPTVLVDTAHPDFNSVTVDDERGGYMVGQHLIAKGHRQFAFVSEYQRSSDYVSPGQRRLSGFTRAVSEADIDSENVHWVITTNDVAGGRAAVEEIMALDPRPTALFAHHDDLAAGILSGLSLAGVDVPGEMSVVGYDGGDLADALQITTVRQPFADTGRLAADLLAAALISPGAPAQHIQLSAELLPGATT